MPLIVISQAAFDEVAKAIRETVPADQHDAYFVGDTIDMDRVMLINDAAAIAALSEDCGPHGIKVDDGSGYCEGDFGI